MDGPVQNGTHKFGNWNTERNAMLRFEFDVEKNSIADAKRTEVLRQQTGRQFPVGNMPELYYEQRNAELEANRFRKPGF